MKFLVSALLVLSSLASVQGFAGTVTFFDPGLGTCGIVNKATDFIVALSHERFDFPGAPSDPNNNPLCGKNLIVNYQGKSVLVTVVARCTFCGVDDIDLSPAAFSVLAPLSVGRLTGVQWDFV